ncbi:MAG: T9SS type A sorting domain-containing protein [Saprospiraceae bacterium]|nr:T9SS type A sorting domain-containing protein [Saprospiraceae bacterium]
MLTGPYNFSNNNTYTIRTYLVFEETTTNPWATNLGAAERAKRASDCFQYINSVYNPYGIFFVNASGALDPLPEYANPSGCHIVFTPTLESSSWPNITDGISITVRKDDPTTPYATGHVSTTATLPYNLFWIKGTEEGVPATRLPVVIHELGHCLGLAHTFAYTLSNGTYEPQGSVCNSAGACSSSTDDNPNHCCGDFCDDTPLNRNLEEFPELCTSCDCIESSPPPITQDINLLRNYMSYSYPTRCRDRFTAEQVARMKAYLSVSSVLNNVLMPTEVMPAGQTNWDTPVQQATTIEVPAGSELIINTTVEMAPGTFIVVRKGGSLVVNGTLTASCGMWGGVVVEGDANKSQSLISDQGYLLLNTTGRIEHAVKAVGVHGFGQREAFPDHTGGIVDLRGRIVNSTTGVQWNRYRNPGIPNAGALNTCLLYVNDDYRGDPTLRVRLAVLNDINQLPVTDCFFADNRTAAIGGKPALGIIANDASFQAVSCIFRDLDEGIFSSTLQSGGNGAFTADLNYFLDCRTGVGTYLPDFFTISGNTFHVGIPALWSASGSDPHIFSGISIRGYAQATGFLTDGNAFAGVGTVDPNDNQYLIGFEIAATGAQENFIRKNDFTNLEFGNVARGNNGGFTGMRYECNSNSNNLVADFYQDFGSSIRSVQGDYDFDVNQGIAAGNEFTGFTGFIISSLYNDGIGPYRYYYLENVPEQTPLPQSYSNVIVNMTTLPNTNCSEEEGPCEMILCEEEYPTTVDFFNQQSDLWVSKKQQIQNATNSSVVDSLQNEINQHRSAMDINGGKVIRFFVSDSAHANTDSVLWWMERMYRYEADLKLMRRAFFSADSASYGHWVSLIPQRHILDSVQAAELASLQELFELLAPFVETDQLHRLPPTVLDSLAQFRYACNEAGWTALSVLRRNQIFLESECSFPGQERGVLENAGGSTVKNSLIFPNPATAAFQVAIPEIIVELFTLDGRLLLRDLPNQRQNEIQVAHLPPGLYWCRLTLMDGTTFTEKLVIAR